MNKRTTIYLDPKLHQAVRMKAVRLSLGEDSADLTAIRDRAPEFSRAYETVLKNLKKDRLL